jgi:hypothetical protein
MNQHLIRCVLLFFGGLVISSSPAELCGAEPKVLAPKKIEYDERLLTYNPSWKNEEVYLETNLDDDPATEIIIGFVAMYVTEPAQPKEEKILFTVPKKELLPITNYVFYQIYDLGADKTYRLTKTFTGMDRPGRVAVVPLKEGQPPVIIFDSPGGERYHDVTVYQWREGGYRQLFNQGTSHDVAIVTQPGEPRIVLGEETFIWDTGKQRFEKIQTAPTENDTSCTENSRKTDPS